MVRLGILLLALGLTGPVLSQDLDDLVADPRRTLGPHRWYQQAHVVTALDNESKLVVFAPRDAAGDPLPGKRPTVVFFPGHGDQVRPQAYTQLRRYLNSHGYAVAMFDFPDKGTVTSPREWIPRYERALTRLEVEARVPGSPLHDTLDLDRLALGGHSFGGAVATEVAARDSTGRYKALFLFASGSSQDKRFLESARRVKVPTIAFGGSYDYSEPPLENDLEIVERVDHAEKAFVLVSRGNHMNAPTDYDSELVGRIRWEPRYSWVGWFPVFAGYEPVFERDATKTAISGPRQKGITFPLMTAWLGRHVLDQPDSDRWLSSRLRLLEADGLLESESFARTSLSGGDGLVGALGDGQ